MDLLRRDQIQGAKRLRELNRGLLCDEMGLGKTRESIAAAAQKKNRKILIITLNRVLCESWAQEIKKMLGDDQKIEVYDSLVKCDCRWTVINYDSARINRNMSILLSNHWDIVIVDEAHKCKNRKRKTKGGMSTNFDLVDKLSRHCNGLYLLTGTPTKGNPSDVWPLLHFIDRKKYSSYWRWAENYIVYSQGYFGREIIGYQNLDLLNDELSEYMIRRKTQEVFKNLPDKNIHIVKCNMLEKQETMYNQMVKDFVSEVGSGVYVTASAQVSRLMRLRQIATCPISVIDPDGANVEFDIPSGKMKVLSDTVQNIINKTDGKLIIFSNWSRVAEYTYRLLSQSLDCDIALYTGKMSKRDLIESKRSFQEDKNTRVFIGTIGASGTGLTLTAADHVIFLDRAWNPDDNKQAENRAYGRANDPHGIDVSILITEGTVDELIYEYVEEKREVVDKIVDNNDPNSEFIIKKISENSQ